MSVMDDDFWHVKENVQQNTMRNSSFGVDCRCPIARRTILSLFKFAPPFHCVNQKCLYQCLHVDLYFVSLCRHKFGCNYDYVKQQSIVT